MPRSHAIDPAQATGKTRTLLDGVREKPGVDPNPIHTIMSFLSHIAVAPVELPKLAVLTNEARL